jgi:hypothetical protein
MAEATRPDILVAETQHLVQPWTVKALIEVCKRKGIVYQETDAFSTLNGIVVQCGSAVTIKVRKSLADPCKVAVIAHELGHLALGHTQYQRTRRWDPRLGVNVELQATGTTLGATENEATDQEGGQDSAETGDMGHREEVEADVWAAYALVHPEVFQQHLNVLRADGNDDETACHGAAANVAHDLHLPWHVIERRLYYDDWQFPEPPYKWLLSEGI